jgi:hypothetical protein
MESTNSIKKFEVYSIYEMRFITDSNLRPEFIVVGRSNKMVIFERFKGSERFKRKIKIDSNGFEYILKDNYSMAPSINSKNIVA